MAIPRNRIFDRTKPVSCHCVSRCVRRTPLLAPQQRRRAMVERLDRLVGVFAIDVLEWTLLSNHFHLVVSTHPDLASLWSDEEVARRWRTISPDYAWRRRNNIDRALPAQPEEIADALQNPGLVARWRRDLADLSTFHKFLKQRLARIINMQDEVTGHCFEGRFKSIVALDEASLIAHMVYVALNPVRASMADSLDSYEFCSIAKRVEQLRERIAVGEFAGAVDAARRKLQSVALAPAMPCNPGESARNTKLLPDGSANPWFGGGTPSLLRGARRVGLIEFLGHVDAVGRVRRPGKRGVIDSATPSPLAGIERFLGGWARSARRRLSNASLRPVIDGVETAMARGLASPVGNFSGSTQALARLARDTGRRIVVAVAGLLDDGRRRVPAAGDPLA